MAADGLTIAVRFGLYLAMSGLFGLSAFALYALRPAERATALALGRWLAALALLALALAVVALVLLAAAMAGTPRWPVDWASIGELLGAGATGLALQVRIAALVVAGVAGAFAGRRRVALEVGAIAAAVALATLAWTGHAMIDEGTRGWVHLIADIGHLIAAATWLGALLGLVLLVVGGARRGGGVPLALTRRALRQFATVGGIVVGAIVVTGGVNAWMLVGPASVMRLGASDYGRLLLVKLALFAAMLGLAALNRFRLVPALSTPAAGDSPASAPHRLRGSLIAETMCACAIFALVAWLGMLEPPVAS